MLVVEPARGGDLGALGRLAADHLDGEIDTEALLEQRARLWVARDVGLDRVVAFAAASQGDACDGHLLAIAVSPSHRSQGIGTALLKTVQRDMALSGALSMSLDVRAGDRGAQMFYGRHGYQPTGLEVKVYKDGGDAVHMERPL